MCSFPPKGPDEFSGGTHPCRNGGESITRGKKKNLSEEKHVPTGRCHGGGKETMAPPYPPGMTTTAGLATRDIFFQGKRRKRKIVEGTLNQPGWLASNSDGNMNLSLLTKPSTIRPSSMRSKKRVGIRGRGLNGPGPRPDPHRPSNRKRNRLEICRGG